MTRQKLVVWGHQAAAWFCIVLIAVLSLAPHVWRSELGGCRVLSNMCSPKMGTAAFLAGDYPVLGWVAVAAALLAYAGCLEALQAFVSGTKLPPSTRPWRVGAGQCSVPLVSR
jgi:hypothetical protein